MHTHLRWGCGNTIPKTIRGTLKQLEEHFPQITDIVHAEGYNDIIPDACLCQVDVEETLCRAGIKYIEDCGDYIIQH